MSDRLNPFKEFHPSPKSSIASASRPLAGALLCPFKEFHEQHRLGLQLIHRGVVVPDRYLLLSLLNGTNGYIIGIQQLID